MPIPDVRATATASTRTTRTIVGDGRARSRKMATLMAASAIQGMTWTSVSQWRSIASSTAVAATPRADRRIKQRRRTPAVPIGELQRQGRDDAVHHARAGVVLRQVLAEL